MTMKKNLVNFQYTVDRLNACTTTTTTTTTAARCSNVNGLANNSSKSNLVVLKKVSHLYKVHAFTHLECIHHIHTVTGEDAKGRSGVIMDVSWEQLKTRPP